MRKERTITNVYFACQEEGSFLQLERVDEDQIKDLLNVEKEVEEKLKK